jgi:acetylornithine/N-succinyldiaminopimelate aminotransferase
MGVWLQEYPDIIADVRGKGLLLLLELHDEKTATHINDFCINNGLFVTQTQSKAIRIFPALNITRDEMEEGLEIIEKAFESFENL